jgi:transcriptional regulator with XRE-family HTH domain
MSKSNSYKNGTGWLPLSLAAFGLTANRLGEMFAIASRSFFGYLGGEEDTTMPTVTERFLEAIKRSGLRKAELAKLTGLSRGQITDIVEGKRSPTLETVDKIAAVIGWPEQSGEFATCDISSKSSIIIESIWQWPWPPNERIDEDPVQDFERFRAARWGSPTYAPGAILRWKKVSYPMPRGEARAVLEALASKKGGEARAVLERLERLALKKRGDKPSGKARHRVWGRYVPRSPRTIRRLGPPSSPCWGTPRPPSGRVAGFTSATLARCCGASGLGPLPIEASVFLAVTWNRAWAHWSYCGSIPPFCGPLAPLQDTPERHPALAGLLLPNGDLLRPRHRLGVDAEGGRLLLATGGFLV